MRGTSLVIIGQAPSQTGDPKDPVASRKLADLLGVPFAEYKTIRRLNLIDHWPGKCGKGDAFPMPAARLRAESLVSWLQGRRALLLGRAAAAAFGLRAPYLRWKDHRGFRAAILPHPSGINRWWNDPRNRRRARRFLRAMVARETKGARACRTPTRASCAR